MAEKAEKVPFEEALNLTGFGVFNIGVALVSYSIIIAMAFETNATAYLVPLSACELGTSSAQQGIMAGIPLLGILVSSNVWGYLADTRGRRKILLVSLILGFITGSSATLAPDWITFSVLKFLSSSSMAGTYGLANAYLSECTPTEKRFRVIVLVSSVFLVAVGSMAGLTIPFYPLTFSYYIPYLNIQFNSWRLLNIIFSLPCILAAIGVYFAVESPKYLLSVGENDKALEVLKRMHAVNFGNKDNYKVGSVTLDEHVSDQSGKGFISSVVQQTVPLFKPPLLKTTLLLALLYITVYVCVTPFTVWTPYLLDGFTKSLDRGETGITFCQMIRSSKNITTQDISSEACTLDDSAMLMVLFIDLLLASLNLVIILALPLLGRKTLLIGLQLAGGTAGLALNFCTTWSVSAVIFVVFLSINLNFGVMTTFAVDLFPTYVKAMGVCLTLMVGRGSAVFGINILKLLIVNSCETAFYLFPCITIIGGILGFLLPSERKRENEKMQQIEELNQQHVAAA